MSTANLPSGLQEIVNPFDKGAVLRACDIEFDEVTLNRAQQYADEGRISNLQFNGNNTITANVQGSDENAYELKVVITRGRENLSLRGTCSCPVRLNCKHVGATLLTWLDQDKEQDSSADSIEVWRNALHDQRDQDEGSLSADPVVVLYRIRQISLQQSVRYEVAAYSARKLRSGGLGKSSPLTLDRRHFDATDLSSRDARICNALIGLKDSPTGLHLIGEHGYMVFRWMVESGSCYYEAFDSEPLTLDINRPICAGLTTIINRMKKSLGDTKLISKTPLQSSN